MEIPDWKARLSLGFRREIRGKGTHRGIFKAKMTFKAKKLQATVSVENKGIQDRNSVFHGHRRSERQQRTSTRTEREGDKQKIQQKSGVLEAP